MNHMWLGFDVLLVAVRGCSYRFSIPTTVAMTAHGQHLAAPLSVPFRVASWSGPAAPRELLEDSHDSATHTLRSFRARPGIHTPVDEALLRYQDEIGIPASALLPQGDWRSSFFGHLRQRSYAQYAFGYPVSGYGYSVLAENGLFHSAVGKVMPNVPAFGEPRLSSAAALQVALDYLKIDVAPWVKTPATAHAPVGHLVIGAEITAPKPSDFFLAWYFPLGHDTGIGFLGIEVDANTGKVTRAESGDVQ